MSIRTASFPRSRSNGGWQCSLPATLPRPRCGSGCRRLSTPNCVISLHIAVMTAITTQQQCQSQLHIIVLQPTFAVHAHHVTPHLAGRAVVAKAERVSSKQVLVIDCDPPPPAPIGVSLAIAVIAAAAGAKVAAPAAASIAVAVAAALAF